MSKMSFTTITRGQQFLVLVASAVWTVLFFTVVVLLLQRCQPEPVPSAQLIHEDKWVDPTTVDMMGKPILWTTNVE